LSRILTEAATAAAPDIGVDPASVPEPELEKPKLKGHGDWSTNLALVLAPKAGRSPREVAEAIAARVSPQGVIEKVQVAGPGFINLFLGHAWLYQVLELIMDQGDAYGRGSPKGERVQVEFVCSNPTGLLHVGTARNAALGDAIASVLATAGYEVQREYYWNDTGTQMELLGMSLEARYLELFGVDAEVPEGGYEGEYVRRLAEQIQKDVGDRLLHEDPIKRRQALTEEGRRRMFEAILATLARFGVRFDTFRTEAEVVESGEVTEAVERLRGAGYAYDADGAVWF